MTKKKTNTVKQAHRVPKKETAKPGNRRIILGGVAILLLVMGVFAGLVFANSLAAEEARSAALPLVIDVHQAYDLYAQGIFLLDVRTQEEWDASHVPNATLIPLDQLENRLNELPRDQEIVVMCRSGNRSQSGRDILLKAGFDQVTSMAGGIRDWSSAGYPTTP